MELTDQQLIENIKTNQDFLGLVYKDSKDYSMRFLRSLSKGSEIEEDVLHDIFQDAIIVLYEKIMSGNFKLTCTIQTYLNTVCKNQLFKRFKSNSKQFNFDTDLNPDSKLKYDPDIEDFLLELKIKDEKQFKALEKGLTAIKEKGGHCYELLTFFWYHKKSMNEIADHFGYTSSVNAKNQKSRCQKRLKKEAYKYLEKAK